MNTDNRQKPSFRRHFLVGSRAQDAKLEVLSWLGVRRAVSSFGLPVLLGPLCPFL